MNTWLSHKIMKYDEGRKIANHNIRDNQVGEIVGMLILVLDKRSRVTIRIGLDLCY